jgi:hypothetical protein
VFQQIPWFATTDTGTVDLNTSFNHNTREWEDAKTNDQPPQQQHQTNNANSYKQKRSVVSALSSFRKNQQNLSNIFVVDVPLRLLNGMTEMLFSIAKFCRIFPVERRR